MNGFSKVFLSLFLVWIKKALNAIWDFFSNSDSFSFFNFIVLHWKIMAFILIIIGVVVDWLLYIARWRPYYVWFGKKNKK